MSDQDRSGGLHVEVVTVGRPPDAIAQRWRELAVAAGNPFVLPEWHAAWVATHPTDKPFVLVCRERSGELAGVVPLVRRGRRLLPAGEQLADWLGPACATADEERVAAAVMDALARAPRRWSVLQLDRCRTDGGWIRGLLCATPGRAIKLLPHRGDDVLLSIDLERDGPELRTTKKRRELQRLSRRLNEDHLVTLRRATTAAQIERDLEALLRLRKARWGASFDAPAEHFLRAFTASLANLDLLRLWVIDVDGAQAGVLLGWRLDRRAFAYSQAFDGAYDRFGVGLALLAHAVRASAEEGCCCFDMLRGDEHFKSSFHVCRDAVTSYRAVRCRSFARVSAEALVAARSAYRRLPPHQRTRLRRALRI